MNYKGKVDKLPEDTSGYRTGDIVMCDHELYKFVGNEFVVSETVLFDVLTKYFENESNSNIIKKEGN